MAIVTDLIVKRLRLETVEQADEIKRLRAALNRVTLKTERWRGALVHVAQGKGDPVAVASKALELDNE